jgi:hypothetical protein
MEKRLVEHVGRIGRRTGAYRVWLEILRERDHLEDIGVDWRLIKK